MDILSAIGNTGIAPAMIGAARGCRVKLVMPACVSVEGLESHFDELLQSCVNLLREQTLRLRRVAAAEAAFGVGAFDDPHGHEPSDLSRPVARIK